MEEPAIEPLKICDRCRRLAHMAVQSAALSFSRPWPSEEDWHENMEFCSRTCATAAFKALRTEFAGMAKEYHDWRVEAVSLYPPKTILMDTKKESQ